jgi:hypothetical protein
MQIESIAHKWAPTPKWGGRVQSGKAGTGRNWGLSVFWPAGYRFFASSSDTWARQSPRRLAAGSWVAPVDSVGGGMSAICMVRQWL